MKHNYNTHHYIMIFWLIMLWCSENVHLYLVLATFIMFYIFTASLAEEEPSLGHTNTLNINRLLRRLEAAISRGRHAEAAGLARELADFRVSCSVTRNPKTQTNSNTELQSQEMANVSGPKDQPPSSNVSECFYDAEEMLEVEEEQEMSHVEHDKLLELGCLNSTVNDSLLSRQETQLVDHKAPPQTSSTMAVAVTSNMMGVNSSPITAVPQVKNKNLMEKNNKHREGEDNSVNDQNKNKVTESKDVSDSGEKRKPQDTKGSNLHPDNSSPLLAQRRDTKVDPARREVKSDTISRLLDNPSEQIKQDVSSQRQFK